MSCKQCEYLKKRLIDEIVTSCDSCEHAGYSTRAMSHYCNSPTSPYNEGWMDTGHGCPHHSEVEELEEKLKNL